MPVANINRPVSAGLDGEVLMRLVQTDYENDVDESGAGYVRPIPPLAKVPLVNRRASSRCSLSDSEQFRRFCCHHTNGGIRCPWEEGV